jgi:hypothetical protein
MRSIVGKRAEGGQIVDATLVAAPKQCNTAPEKEAMRAGKSMRKITDFEDRTKKLSQDKPPGRMTLIFRGRSLWRDSYLTPDALKPLSDRVPD